MNAANPPLITDELPPRVAPDEIEDAGQFRVTVRAEISHLLEQLARQHEFVCLYVDRSDNFALSSLLAVESDRLVFDMPKTSLGLHLTAVQQLYCVSSLQRVKLQFEVESPAVIDWQGGSAIVTSLPKDILRIQRRDFYRLSVPVANPLSCFVPTRHGEELEVSLSDISVGGVGMLGYVPGLRLIAGARINGVHIELPDTGTVVVDLEIRSREDVTMKNGIRTVRVGAKFINPTSATQSLIQRYITRVERERLARDRL